MALKYIAVFLLTSLVVTIDAKPAVPVPEPKAAPAPRPEAELEKLVSREVPVPVAQCEPPGCKREVPVPVAQCEPPLC